MKVKIYGNGWVGKSVKKLFPEAIVVDPKYSHYLSSRDARADVAFVCVPTPLKDGALDCSIVEQVVRESEEDLIVLRSTVQPGFCEKFRFDRYKDSEFIGHKNIVYQPEYLGETVGHPLFDEKNVPFMILGGTPENRRKVIELYQGVYNANIKIRQVTNYEAEIIKVSENRAIAFKVAQCQELYDACERAGVDYNTIREAVYGDDPRFNLFWTFVYPSARGFNSKCIPKDVYGWAAWAESVGYDPKLTTTMLAVNERYINAMSQVSV
jgi:UDPglucose 6-dehydrogenase